jgi:hypothetical protein
VSGNNPQFVLQLKLDTRKELPLVHLAEQTELLMPGTMVRLNVGESSPFSWCLPGVYPIQGDWFRADLVWQFTGSNPQRLSEWQQVIAELKAVKS